MAGGPRLNLAHITPALHPLALAVSSLRADPANARKHDARNIAVIAASLQRFGQQKPLVLYPDGCTILAGSGTWEAARSLNWEYIAAAPGHLSGLQAIAFGIADNRTAELAEWDFDRLADLLGGLGDSTATDLGWSAEEVKSLIGGDWQPDQVGEMPTRGEGTSTGAPIPATPPAGAAGANPRQGQYVTVSAAEWAILGRAIQQAGRAAGESDTAVLRRITEAWLSTNQ